MKKSLQQALDNVDMTYDQLVSIANNISNSYLQKIDNIVSDISQLEKMNNDTIRDAILKLCLNAFTFSGIKEKAILKAECAEALRKEAYAIEFSAQEGSVAAKDSTATVNTSNEMLTEAIYNLVANLFKVKLDELHRLVDSLKTVLTSRLQEAKLNSTISID